MNEFLTCSALLVISGFLRFLDHFVSIVIGVTFRVFVINVDLRRSFSGEVNGLEKASSLTMSCYAHSKSPNFELDSLVDFNSFRY